jgi:hypothetical protein
MTRTLPRRRLVLAGALVALATLSSTVAVHASARHDERRSGSALTLRWFDLTNQTVAAAAFPEQSTQGRVWAVSWLAAARAIDDGDGSTFRNAALVTALHDTLVAQVPAQTAQLDAAQDSSLEELPDGAAKRRGVAAGHHEATTVLSERAADGLDTDSVNAAWTPPPAAPGVWQPTPPTYGPAVRAGLGKARSFLLASNDQFRPGPPPALDSAAYLDGLSEVRSAGRDTDSTRTPEQTDVALFWEQSSLGAYNQVLRAVLSDTDRGLLWQSRLVAAFHVITIDAQIAIHEAKYTYVFWRPVTAIRTGSVDQDPDWTPLFATPRHPEYPSGHTGYAGAAQVALAALVGARPSDPIPLTSPTEPGTTHTFTTWSQITQENINGRVWEGVHFRFSDETGAQVGRKVADWDLPRLHAIGL